MSMYLTSLLRLESAGRSSGNLASLCLAVRRIRTDPFPATPQSRGHGMMMLMKLPDEAGPFTSTQINRGPASWLLLVQVVPGAFHAATPSHIDMAWSHPLLVLARCQSAWDGRGRWPVGT